MKWIMVVLIIGVCLGFSVELNEKRKRFCMKIEIEENQKFEGSYLVSGESEEHTAVQVLLSLYFRFKILP